jgi:hypothetical protein
MVMEKRFEKVPATVAGAHHHFPSPVFFTRPHHQWF